MTAAMVGVRGAVDGPSAIVVGAVVGLGVYVGTLHALGVDPRDRLIVRELTGRYRADIADALPV